jgi:hypothetical protein
MRTHMIHMIMALVTGTIFAMGCPFSGSAWSQNIPTRTATTNASAKPIGKVVTAKGAITIKHVNAVIVQATLDRQAGSAKVGDLVYLGDVVQTGVDGRVGIAFADGTAFNLSNNARVILNEFVYDPHGTSNSTFFTLAKGTFTFIAGKVARTGNMKIDTPIATMGIRGTTPHVEISDDGTVKFSTLIETGKNEVLEKNGAVTIKSHNGAVSPETSPPKDHRKKLNLKICNEC